MTDIIEEGLCPECGEPENALSEGASIGMLHGASDRNNLRRIMRRMLAALQDAIESPMGTVPKSADEFYDTHVGLVKLTEPTAEINEQRAEIERLRAALKPCPPLGESHLPYDSKHTCAPNTNPSPAHAFKCSKCDASKTPSYGAQQMTDILEEALRDRTADIQGAYLQGSDLDLIERMAGEIKRLRAKIAEMNTDMENYDWCLEDFAEKHHPFPKSKRTCNQCLKYTPYSGEQYGNCAEDDEEVFEENASDCYCFDGWHKTPDQKGEKHG